MRVLTLSDARRACAEAVFEVTHKFERHMPVVEKPAGTLLLRTVDARERTLTSRQARCVPPNSSYGETHRLEGRVSATASHGGLNLGDTAGALNELGHYAHALCSQMVAGVPVLFKRLPGETATDPSKEDFKARTPWLRQPVTLQLKKTMYAYRLREAVELVDLDVRHKDVRDFLREVQNDSHVRSAHRALADLGYAPGDTIDLVAALSAADRMPVNDTDPDYLADSRYGDVTRALGVAALLRPGSRGLQAMGVHNDLVPGKRSDGNVVLGGDDGEELDVLEPEYHVAGVLTATGNQILLSPAGTDDLESKWLLE